MAEPLEDAVEAEDKKVAVIIAILALFLALSEAGAKNAQHRSTEQNIEASDLFNFYQAKKVRSTIAETAAESLEAIAPTVTDEKASAAIEKQIAALEGDRRQVRTRPEEARGQPRRNSGTRERGPRGARALQPPARAFRIRERRAADRDRARLCGDHHRGRRSRLGGGRPRAGRRDLMGFGYLAPTALPFLGG